MNGIDEITYHKRRLQIKKDLLAGKMGEEECWEMIQALGQQYYEKCP